MEIERAGPPAAVGQQLMRDPLRKAAPGHRRAHGEHPDQEERDRIGEPGEALADARDRTRADQGHDGDDRGDAGRHGLEPPEPDGQHDHGQDALALGGEAGGHDGRDAAGQ